jgi:hypothetical protein
VTQVESAELDDDKEENEIRYAFCEPVYRVPLVAAGPEPVRRQYVPSVNYVEAWRLEQTD